MAFHALQEILDKDMPFWRAVLLEDMQDRSSSEESSKASMEKLWKAMVAASESYDGSLRSSSGLVGGMGRQMEDYRRSQSPLCGEFMAEVITQALEMGESNACMKRIVAAPTAGACGVLPAVLLPLYRNGELTQDGVLPALYTAAGIGQVIASRAFIAGAAGGCQAEIGTASAMAAGALVQIRGGTGEQIAQAAGMALKNLLGLVCDPVAGLVEVPCVKRNVVGAVNALSCADMAMAGITSRIPPDQVIDAMAEIGRSMHVSLRETGEGGVANTPAAREIREKLGM
jgi:L-serine dehydratase